MSKQDLELMNQIAEFAKTFRPGTLLAAHELPKFVLDIPTPEGIILAADYKQEEIYQLEGYIIILNELIIFAILLKFILFLGEVHALKLIDLDKEGLAAYKKHVSD